MSVRLGVLTFRSCDVLGGSLTRGTLSQSAFYAFPLLEMAAHIDITFRITGPKC